MTEYLIRKCVKNSEDATSPAVRAACGKMAGIVGILCNVLLCAAKLLVGALSGSISITADAVNNLSDASSSVITLLGFKLAERPADEEHPFGHARIEYLSGLAVAILIIVIGLELAKTSLGKILHPSAVEFSLVTVAVLAASILVKLWMMVFNRTVGKRIGSATLQATAADSRNDVITTSAVLAAAVFGAVSGLNIDGWMGLAVALFILCSGVGIVRDTLDPILGAAPDEAFVNHIAQKILSYDGVLGTHDLMVHDYGPGRRFGSVHVEMDAKVDPMRCHDVIDNIERYFLREEHFHLVIHYDPVITDEEDIGSYHALVKQVLHSISPQLSMHDFRMVTGPTHTNLIFDVVMPRAFTLSESALKSRIESLVRAQDQTLYTVVTVDRSFACVPHGEEEEAQ